MPHELTAEEKAAAAEALRTDYIYINACDPGLFCANPDAVPNCDANGCCAPFCDINAPDCPDMQAGVECVPWNGELDPCVGPVGTCVVP